VFETARKRPHSILFHTGNCVTSLLPPTPFSRVAIYLGIFQEKRFRPTYFSLPPSMLHFLLFPSISFFSSYFIFIIALLFFLITIIYPLLCFFFFSIIFSSFCFTAIVFSSPFLFLHVVYFSSYFSNIIILLSFLFFHYFIFLVFL
jgi:hypothetical protein